MNLKNKINLTIIFLFVLVFILTLSLIHPTFLKIKNISKEIKETQAKTTFLAAENKNLDDFRKFYKENEENFKKLDKLFINPAAPVEFISFLEKTAQTVGLSLKISPAITTKNPKDPWPSLSFQLILSSSFPDFLKFLAKLESSPYLIEVQDLTINKLIESELPAEEFKKLPLGSVKVNVLIKVYTE